MTPRTVRGYKTALTNHYSPDVVDIKNSDSLTRLLTKYFNDKPPVISKVLPWDLGKVLNLLCNPPFEPLQTATLKCLTFKTVFLFALASGRRRSEIHSLDFHSLKWSEQNGVTLLSISPVLGFLPKNQRSTDSKPQNIVIPSLPCGSEANISSTQDQLLCPIRSIIKYIDRTKEMRHDKQKLFISYLPSKVGDICSITISSWLRNTIQMAYSTNGDDSSTPKGIRPHQIRSAAASWALKGGVSISQLMDACYWHSKNTFISFYLKDCWSQGDGRFSFGPIVSAGTVVGSHSGVG